MRPRKPNPDAPPVVATPPSRRDPSGDPLIGDELSPSNRRRASVAPSAWRAIRFQQGGRTLVESWLPPAKLAAS